MNLLLWRAHQWARRLGRSGIGGLILLLIAAILQFGQVGAIDHERATLAARLDALRMAARTEPETVAVPSVGFIDALPNTATASVLIGELEKVARAHQVQLLRGQYSQSAVAGTSLVRWQLTLPITADYPHLHAFIGDSLQKVTALTLEDLRLKRETIAATDLNADLRFNLYLREGTQ